MSRPGAFRLLAGSPFLFVPLSGAPVLDVADRQPQQLDGGRVGGEVAPVLGDFAQLVVERLDAVGGVDDPAQHRREGQEGHEPVPGVGEGLDGRGVALTQLAAVKGVQGLHGGLLVGCLVDRPQPRADGFAVLVRHEPCGGPDQVDHAGLDGGPRPGGFDGLSQAG